MAKPERPPITPEYLEECGPPNLIRVADDIYAIVSGDGYETVDMTFEQAVYLYHRMRDLVGDEVYDGC